LLTGPEAAGSLGVLLKYEAREGLATKVPATAAARAQGAVRLGVVGVGNFCTGTLLPHLKGVEGVEMVGVADNKGIASKGAADKFGFRYAASSADDLLGDKDINAVLIATRHISHGPLVCAALKAGKAVYVEKPLALDAEQLAEVVRAQRETGGFVFVGHNRRFSPMAKQIAAFFKDRSGPLLMTYRVNAGPLDSKHWMRATEEGGSRIISEGCHFIDTMMFLAGAAPVRVAGALPQGAHEPDTGHGVITFADGSVGTLTYVTTCDPSLPKERLEVFADGKGAVLDNFRALYLYSGGKETERKSAGQDKGHKAEMQLFGELVRTGGQMPVPMDQLAALSLSTFGIIESATSGKTIDIDLAPLFAAPEIAETCPAVP
jgi:predicted dehydrogenase